MNPYIKLWKTCLPKNAPDCSEEEAKSLLDMLYYCYRERNPILTQEIRKDFAGLNDILSKLPLRENDQVGNLTCKLCSEHEQAAFFDGFRVAVLLGAQLWKEWES